MIAGVLLAAGESTRMGQPKALLPWAGTTLLEYGVEQVDRAVDLLVVVLGHRAADLAKLTPSHVVNDRYREGRSTSIETGVRAVPPDADAVLITSVDQPRPAGILRRLVEAHLKAGALISRPVFGREHGHPTVFGRPLFQELRALSEETEGLKSVLRRHADAMNDVDLGDPIVLLNLNRPDEYSRAYAHYH